VWVPFSTYELWPIVCLGRTFASVCLSFRIRSCVDRGTSTLSVCPSVCRISLIPYHHDLGKSKLQTQSHNRLYSLTHTHIHSLSHSHFHHLHRHQSSLILSYNTHTAIKHICPTVNCSRMSKLSLTRSSSNYPFLYPLPHTTRPSQMYISRAVLCPPPHIYISESIIQPPIRLKRCVVKIRGKQGTWS
jgi:hypothetical protein